MTRTRFCAAVLALLLLAGCTGREPPPPPESPPESSSRLEEEAPAPPEEEVVVVLPSAETEPPPADREPVEPDSPEHAAPAVEILTLTVPEGYTLAKIGMTLEEKGICTAEEFIHAGQTGDYSDFSLVAAQTPDERRCFRLEGYLFPDTYEIYSNDPPEAIIRRMLSRLEQKIDPGLRQTISASGYTVDEVLILASIIEKEAFGHNQMPAISSVLHNRLEQGMRLQCDVTITYVEGAIKPFIDGDINRYNGYYNTYKCNALPAGAICNPGLDAIRAALAPAETDYLYFLTDADKNYYYAVTYEEHQTNEADVKQGRITEPDPS